MKEHEYITVTNSQKLRMACEILSDVMPDDLITRDELNLVIERLDDLRDRVAGKIESMVR